MVAHMNKYKLLLIGYYLKQINKLAYPELLGQDLFT